MFKFAVLATILAVASATPSGIGYAAPALVHAAPTIVKTITPYISYDGPSSAVTHQHRADYISKPVVAGYSAPVISKSVVSTPVAVKTVVDAVPVVSTYAHFAPAWTAPVASSYGHGAWATPAVSAYSGSAWAAPAVSAYAGSAWAAPAVSAYAGPAWAGSTW